MHSQLKAGRLAHRVLATTLLFVPIILTPVAPAAPLFLSVDEWGKGFVCDGGGGLGGGSAIPLCQPSGVSPFGTFERLASGFGHRSNAGGRHPRTDLYSAIHDCNEHGGCSDD
jgi:hypothetical protein